METVAIAALSTLVILFLWWLFFHEYRAYRVRVLRLHLFEARDRLFDKAQRGDLSFDDRAYGMVRSLINGLIKSADSLSIFHMVLFRLFVDREDKNASYDRFASRFGGARAQLTTAGQAAVDEALGEAHFCVLSHVMHISVLIAPVLFAAKLWIRIASLRSGYANEMSCAKVQVHARVERVRAVGRYLDSLDEKAFELGHASLDGQRMAHLKAA